MLDPNINAHHLKYLIKNYSHNDNKNEKNNKLRFYYQSLEKRSVLDLVFNVNIHFQCHPELIPLWKKLQLFTWSSSYFVNISFVQEGLYHVQGSKDE